MLSEIHFTNFQIFHNNMCLELVSELARNEKVHPHFACSFFSDGVC